MALQAKSFYINDKSPELINLYRNISDNNTDFMSWSLAISHSWSSMKEFVVKHDELTRIYTQYKARDLSESDLDDIIVRFVSNNKCSIDDILDKKFIWYRDVLPKECRKNLRRKMIRMRRIEDKMELYRIATPFLI